MTDVTVTVGVPGIEINAGTSGAAADLGSPVVKEFVNADPWEGAYEITPGDTEQVLGCEGYRMTQNVKVNAIPSNYGKISWNGAALTVT